MYNAYFYRIYDTGNEIDLNTLEKNIPLEHSFSRTRLSRLKTKSIHMQVPPLLINLGIFSVLRDNSEFTFNLQARIYDIGAISICAGFSSQSDGPPDIETIALLFAGQNGLDNTFAAGIHTIRHIIRPCLAIINFDPQCYEDYNIYHVYDAAQVPDPLPLLMGEKVKFSPQLREQMMSNRLSYTSEDFAIITWDTALLCDREDPADLRDLIEFANVQLLELRYYDAILTRQMDKMYDDIELAETKSQYWRIRQYRKMMSTLMKFIADITEVTEKIDNLIKITEDVYYARVYQSALRVLRTDQWSESVNRKLNVIQKNYTMLSNEVNIQHSNFLEWIIIILIALEFCFAIIDTLI